MRWFVRLLPWAAVLDLRRGSPLFVHLPWKAQLPVLLMENVDLTSDRGGRRLGRGEKENTRLTRPKEKEEEKRRMV